MNLWLRSRRRRVIATIMIAQLVHPWIISGAAVPLPNLLTSSLIDTPIAALAPIILVGFVQVALDTDRHDCELCPVARFHLLDVALIVVVAALGLLSGMVATWLIESHAQIAWSRNALCYLGIGLIARSAGGTKVMGLAPLVFGMVTILFGRGSDGLAETWAIPVLPAGSPPALILAVTIFVVGASFAAGSPPHETRWALRARHAP